MKVTDGPLAGLRLVEPVAHRDARGAFRETWQADRYGALGFPAFIQDNLVESRGGVLRGLHFQHPNAQAKLVWVVRGEVFDVVVDVRGRSPTRGRHASFLLSEGSGHQLFVPPGFAHGYLALGERAVVAYKCSAPWSPVDERIIRWDDPDLAIAWPVAEPVLSARDAAGLRLRDMPTDWLPDA